MTPHRYLHLLADSPADGTAHPATVDEESATAGAAPSPAPATSIAPWELEDGDLLVDHPAARVRLPLFYTAGQWLVYDGDDRLIARLPHGVDVAVVRAGAQDVEGAGGACHSAAVDPAWHDHPAPSTLTDEAGLAATVGRHPAGGAR